MLKLIPVPPYGCTDSKRLYTSEFLSNFNFQTLYKHYKKQAKHVNSSRYFVSNCLDGLCV